eukprot:MONOS_5432.1-p1 / transcript=MONOS_5432.1 / gene=MONOS_5432 / organism=Monocercomonoides_exilis_PA203 / gene_product=unspecified product / transcript_product=unspecified product / location=Mono_scaffold00157:101515-103133(-) / protein_length=521 / sequence_SO=supercontig / SO=protein_coding / is_pseudo=false
MTVNNVQGVVGNTESSENTVHDSDVDSDFSNPLYFTHLNDGTIQDVAADEDDSEDQVALKIGVAYALRTNIIAQSNSDYESVNVVDPQGSHFEYFQTESDGSSTIVNSHYTEDDFVAFLDEGLSAKNVSIDASNVRQIMNDRIVSSKSQTSINLYKDVDDVQSNDESAATMFVYGTTELNNFAMGNSEEVNFEFQSPEEFMQANGHLVKVPYLNYAYYLNRRPEIEEEEEDLIESDFIDGKMACPGDTDVCRGFDKSYTFGNKNIGLKISASAVAAVKKGCKLDGPRSYIAGAYGDIDILILGKTFSAAHAYAEYGQLYGSPTRNAIELSLFGHVFYQKSFPWLDCVDRTITLATWNKDLSFSYSIMVYVVKITFKAGVTFEFSASLHYSLCVQQLTASVQLIPRGKATAHAGAEASVAVAKAGITLSGSIAEHLDPTAYVDGNQCRVGFYMYANHEPYDVRFEGWWQLRTKIKVKVKWHGFKTKVKIQWGWGSKHSKTFWHHSGGGSRSKLVDVYYQAK